MTPPRIIAVIPARAGSKRIPNKNIRLLNSRPLVSYVIECAQRSELITKVIVTTDSHDVKTIANQMGVECHWREASLCGDDVTLDPVIHDAIQGEECDYVVTLQATSPLLEPRTLDSAIRHCIDNDFDTVISVRSYNRLRWKKNDSTSEPQYAERLNSQSLPPTFFETGAFLISKRDVVTRESRIGVNNDIYETSRIEAVTIESFVDLALASAILQERKTGIFVNGNDAIGTGHIYRVLELSDEFFSKPDIYYDENLTDVAIFGNTSHSLFPVNGLDGLYEALRGKDYSVFISDILTTSEEYMNNLGALMPQAKKVNFEDDSVSALLADLVINALYQHSDHASVYAGERYYIAPKQFLYYHPIEIKEAVSNVFISFGGSDPMSYTERVLSIVQGEKYKDYRFTVVLGRANRNAARLLAEELPANIEMHHDVGNMPELMTGCDIAMASRGRTCYELAILGIPTISIAANERETTHDFVCHDNGFNYLGLNPSDRIIEASLDMYLGMTGQERQSYQDLLLNHDLRNGRSRVLNLIRSL